jgi:hypothetical protein
MTPLAGQRVLVTGAARRLGRAIALALAGEGMHVAVHYRSSEQEARATADAVRAAGVQAWLLRADLAVPDEVDGLAARAAEETGGLEALVNSASMFRTSRLLDFERAELMDNLQVNALAPLQLARAFAARGGDGHIVNLLDTRIATGDETHAAYHLSKRMLFTLTRMLATELAPRIRVNAVAPGLVLPPPGKDEAFLQRHARTNPLQSVGSADEVAAAVVFLLRSRFITGQVIYVDGGYHMKGMRYG